MNTPLTKVDQLLWSNRSENQLDAALYEKGFTALLNGEHEVNFVPVPRTAVPALKVERSSKGFTAWKAIPYGAAFTLEIR